MTLSLAVVTTEGRQTCLQRVKQTLAWVGSKVPQQRLLDVQMILNYMRIGRWMHDHGYVFPTLVRNRERCWDHVGRMIGSEPVLYLEFGVHKGAATRYWANLLTHPDSELHGFDSFEGLPETFDQRRGVDRGRFDVGGEVPAIDDPRVRFHKGWFDDTLPKFTPPDHHHLFINLDADLYSSTISVLRYLDRWIKPGTLIYFDDLSHVGHEALAFDDYLADSGKKFEAVVTEWGFNRVILRCVK